MRRRLEGIVTSNKMNKTIAIRVEGIRIHPKYHKRYKVFKKYHAHSEHPVQIGEKVVIEESRPISRSVRWAVVPKVKS